VTKNDATDLASMVHIANPMAQLYARMTVTPDQVIDGMLCACDACLRDGQHEPACPVHSEPRGECRCDREDQTKGAG